MVAAACEVAVAAELSSARGSELDGCGSTKSMISDELTLSESNAPASASARALVACWLLEAGALIAALKKLRMPGHSLGGAPDGGCLRLVPFFWAVGVAVASLPAGRICALCMPSNL